MRLKIGNWFAMSRDDDRLAPLNFIEQLGELRFRRRGLYLLHII
jgi:hypothetical protein